MTLKEFLLKQNNLEDEKLPLCFYSWSDDDDDDILLEVTDFNIETIRMPDHTEKRVIVFYGRDIFRREEHIEEMEEVLNAEGDDIIERPRRIVNDSFKAEDMYNRNIVFKPTKIDEKPLTSAAQALAEANGYAPQLADWTKTYTPKNLHDALHKWNEPKDDIVDMLKKNPLTPNESVDPLTYEWGIFKEKKGGHVIKF